jgi:hypothetical protein
MFYVLIGTQQKPVIVIKPHIIYSRSAERFKGQEMRLDPLRRIYRANGKVICERCPSSIDRKEEAGLPVFN